MNMETYSHSTVLTPVLQILFRYAGNYEGDIQSKLKISFQANKSLGPLEPDDAVLQ